MKRLRCLILAVRAFLAQAQLDAIRDANAQEDVARQVRDHTYTQLSYRLFFLRQRIRQERRS